jgi:hypothetical protein
MTRTKAHSPSVKACEVSSNSALFPGRQKGSGIELDALQTGNQRVKPPVLRAVGVDLGPPQTHPDLVPTVAFTLTYRFDNAS